MINVLSIDWDYFSRCSDFDRLTLFPDGGNEEIGLSMSTMVWSMCYSSSLLNKQFNNKEKTLFDIDIRQDEFDFIKECILNNRKPKCVVNLADSHADIYDFLLEHDECAKKKSLNIYNIDHHSDCYNLGDGLNCGNWVNKLDEQDLINQYTWIYDDKKEKITTLSCKHKSTKKINVIEDIEWDYIFICRSSIWSPPHLDKYFNTLYDFFMFDCWLGFNEKFFIDRYELIKDEIERMTNAKKELYQTMNRVKEHNKKCDCTDDLAKLKKLIE